MLGKRLKQLRNSAGLTQKELANKMNISSSAVSMYEAGRRDPDTETLVKFSKVFNVTTDYLLGKDTKVVTQEHLTNTYERIKEDLGEDVQIMFHDITSFDEGEREELKNFIEFIKSKKNKAR